MFASRVKNLFEGECVLHVDVEVTGVEGRVWGSVIRASFDVYIHDSFRIIKAV